MAVQHTYTLQPGDMLMQACISNTRVISRQQVVLGGHRLALLLDALCST